MKTFLKRFGFLAILAIMFNVEVVGQTFQPGIYAFVNDTMYNTSSASWEKNPYISGIAGETIKFAYLDENQDTIFGNWNVNYGDTAFSDTVFQSLDTLRYVFSNNVTAVTSIDFFTDEISPCNFYVYTKFATSTLFISSVPPGTKSSKNETTLYLSDFEINLKNVNISTCLYDIVFWHCVDTTTMTDVVEHEDFSIIGDTATNVLPNLEYTPIDSGNYFVELKIKYINHDNGVEVCYYRNIISTNSIFVDNKIHTTILFNSTKEMLTIYPNPTTDVLNISEEVEYSVYSYSGQEILRGFGKEIDVAKLSVGTYILKTDKGDSKFTVVR